MSRLRSDLLYLRDLTLSLPSESFGIHRFLDTPTTSATECIKWWSYFVLVCTQSLQGNIQSALFYFRSNLCWFGINNEQHHFAETEDESGTCVTLSVYYFLAVIDDVKFSEKSHFIKSRSFFLHFFNFFPFHIATIVWWIKDCQKATSRVCRWRASLYSSFIG